jgi:hypothetical protein
MISYILLLFAKDSSTSSKFLASGLSISSTPGTTKKVYNKGNQHKIPLPLNAIKPNTYNINGVRYLNDFILLIMVLS